MARAAEVAGIGVWAEISLANFPSFRAVAASRNSSVAGSLPRARNYEWLGIFERSQKCFF